MTNHDSKLERLAQEREQLKAKESELKKQIDSVNKAIVEALGTAEEYRTDNYHFVRKVIINPEHMVKESVSQPLKVYKN